MLTPWPCGVPSVPTGTLPLVSWRRKRWPGHRSRGLSLRGSAGDSQLPVSQQLQMSRVPSTGAQLQQGASVVTRATPPQHPQSIHAPRVWVRGASLCHGCRMPVWTCPDVPCPSVVATHVFLALLKEQALFSGSGAWSAGVTFRWQVM